jgi:hypothetical protein
MVRLGTVWKTLVNACAYSIYIYHESKFFLYLFIIKYQNAIISVLFLEIKKIVATHVQTPKTPT